MTSQCKVKALFGRGSRYTVKLAQMINTSSHFVKHRVCITLAQYPDPYPPSHLLL